MTRDTAPSYHPTFTETESNSSPVSVDCGEQSAGSGTEFLEPQELIDFVHELRQPLSTIECLTSYLEMVCTDGATRNHLHRIHDLLHEANHIIERVRYAH